MKKSKDLIVNPKMTRHKTRLRKRHRSQIASVAIYGICAITFSIALATLLRPIGAQENQGSDDKGNSSGGGNGSASGSSDSETILFWRKGYEGFGTTHEQLGQPHFSLPEYTKFNKQANYTEPGKNRSRAMAPVYSFTHYIFDNIMASDQPILPGYVVVKGEDTLVLGPKVEQNDWADLIGHYWLIMLWILLLVILIVVIPFVAICYCCFCCCRRCRQGCPPCDNKKDSAKRCCYGLLLLLLIIGLLFGVIIAFVTNAQLDRGLKQSTDTMVRGGQDTCSFLKNVGDHIHHLFVTNYAEMETQLITELNDVHKHIFLDLLDTSETNALEDLLRILENIPQALTIVNDLDILEKEFRFLASQLRDAVRGAKRDVNFAVVVLCGTEKCQNFPYHSDLEFVDTSKCLHHDLIPNTTVYVESIEKLLKVDYARIPKRALGRLKRVATIVKEKIQPNIPPLIRDIINGRDLFSTQSTKIRSLIDAAISDIHLNTMRTSKSFDDVYERFGRDRHAINIIVCVLLLIILIILIIALLFGCCGNRTRGYRNGCCNKSTGGSCLLLAIVLIFALFSFIALIGLFYFMFGLVTYHGACAPLRDTNNNALFRQLDGAINLNKYLPHVSDSESMPPFRMSNAIDACKANQTIFQLLANHGLYDVSDIRRIRVMSSPDLEPGQTEAPFFKEALKDVVLLTEDEIKTLREVPESNFSSYHSSVYKDHLCRKFTPINLRTLATKLRDLASYLTHEYYGWAYISLRNEAYHFEEYEKTFVPQLTDIVNKMTAHVEELDRLVLYEHYTFKESVTTLIDKVEKAQKFIQTKGTKFVNALGKNLTEFLEDSVNKYVEMVMRQAHNDVGHCAPLSYIYYRGVELVCDQIVDPMNGFWVGVLLCCLLFLPLLFVAHKLLCLYKKVYPYAGAPGGAVEGGEYLYDGYSDRDHVPLANAPRKRRKGYDRRREHQEYYEDASPGVPRTSRAEAAAAGGSSNMRYNDMAPTHWDHEVPRYHQNTPAAPPSSEYERPPPYYYPGADDQD